MSLVWVHEDAITLAHPAVAAAGPNPELVFIWDSAEQDRRGYSLKRRVFIYECVHDLGIPIYAGTPFQILKALAQGGPIYAAASPDPYIQKVLSDLKNTHDVRIVEPPRLAHIPPDTDIGRFFRFWNRAKSSALVHSSEQVIEDRNSI